MIDSNVQTTIGSPIEWYKLEVLRDVVSVKDAWESYSKAEASGVQVDTGVILARTRSLFNSLYAYLKRKFSDEKFSAMKLKLFSTPVLSEADLREIFWDIQTQLDHDNITKMDTRNRYDGTRVEKENAIFGD